jgi:hypothetical protein
MDIKIIDNFFSKTGLSDYENILDEPRWSIVKNISASYNKGAGLERHFGKGKEEDHFYLSLYPIHVISKFLDKEYYCARMRLRVTWPSDDTGSEPHIDETDSDYDITAVIYLHDSDGDLIIYDQIGPETFNKDAKFKRITPKANTCVLMLKKYWHHAMWPVNSPLRYSININLKEFT